MKKYTSFAFVTLVLLAFTLPHLAYAAEFAGIKGIITAIGGIVKMLIILAAGVALLGFFWGLAKTIFSAGDPKAVEEGKSIMKWGLLALFIMVSVWGIIIFFQNELGIQSGGTLILPTGKDSPCGGPCPTSV